MSLKKSFREQLLKAMKEADKNPGDIVDKTTHDNSYVSRIMNYDTNLCFDTADNIIDAIGCTIELKITYYVPPKP